MLARYAELARQWISTARGRSYWTCAPKLSEGFRPSQLPFYYRDFSPKTHWIGAVNDRGVPIVEEVGGRVFCHPILLAQKALGHWNLWQEGRRSHREHLDAFMTLASWLHNAQEANGGWSIDSMRKPSYLLPYSAVAQGQIVSVLVRACLTTGEQNYLEAARRGIAFMLTPIDQGGTSRPIPEGLLLEEYPKRQCNGVLNGWIHALFGLYDFLLIETSSGYLSHLESSTTALAACLPRYDLGFWSKYDLSGIIASPYYHEAHIAQLVALEVTFPAFAQQFSVFRERLETYAGSRLCRWRAVALKALQKVANPPETVLMAPKPAS